MVRRNITLIDRQEGLAVLRTQPFRDRFISSRQSLLTIHNHQRHAGFSEGEAGLLPDFRKELTVVIEDQAPGIHHLEFSITPIAVLIGAISRHTWLVVNNRLTTSTETIHQGGLADVGTADDCYDRTRQDRSSKKLS